MEKQTKDLKLHLQLTPEEHSLIKKKAKAVNMSMNKLAKYLLINTTINLRIE
jgi:predicted HicB family RNase H-like nuclease